MEEKQNIEWRPVKGYEGLYEVSNYGDVRNVIRNKSLKLQNQRGYFRVTLAKNGKPKNFAVHRLVAYSFIGEQPKENYQINHIDGNKHNNHFSNLEWVTPKENTQHSIRTGLRKPMSEEAKHSISEKFKEMWKNEEYRQWQTDMMLQRWNDPEKRASTIQNMRGKTRTPEQIEKYRQAGLKQDTYKVINLTTGEIFDSAREAAQKYARTTEAIRMCLYGKSKTCAKCKWEVYND